MLLGKIYRIFDEIRRKKVKAIMPDSWAWNAHLVWVKVLRHGEKNRLHESVRGRVISDTLQNPPEMCKESVFELPILLQNQANPQFL